MADLDLELLERVARWCAEAGRQTTPAGIRAALGGLTWDELLAARALLADPPPGRPLGPQALADLARGGTVDQVIEREREGRSPAAPEGGPAAPPAQAAPPPRPVRARAGARAAAARPVLVVRKPSAPASAAAPPRPALPLLDELLLPPGRNTLEQLIRRHGGRRPALLAALAASHRRPDAAPLADADLDRLLAHHGLDRAYRRRERDEVLHAVRAAGGILARAAAALGHDAAGLAAALARLEATAEVETYRAARRADLAGRGTLSERAHLLLTEGERLADLGLLEAVTADLRARLPEHLRALGASREPLPLALARSLSLPDGGVADLATRLGMDLGRAPPPAGGDAPRPAAGSRAPPRFREGQVARGPRPARAAGGARGGPSRPGAGPRGGEVQARRPSTGSSTRPPGGAGPADRRPRDPRAGGPAGRGRPAPRGGPGTGASRSSAPRPPSARPTSAAGPGRSGGAGPSAGRGAPTARPAGARPPPGRGGTGRPTRPPGRPAARGSRPPGGRPPRTP